jgi:hypothetical protein
MALRREAITFRRGERMKAYRIDRFGTADGIVLPSSDDLVKSFAR